MAGQAGEIYSKKAVDKMRRPEDLDKYLRVAGPGLWAVLCASVVLIAGLLIWGFFGTVVSMVSVSGVELEGKAVCFLTTDEKAHVESGDVANVNGKRMKVESVSTLPLSRDEAGQKLKSDYLIDTLIKENWAYLVTFDGNPQAPEEGLCFDVHIMAERMSPISLVLGGGR